MILSICSCHRHLLCALAAVFFPAALSAETAGASAAAATTVSAELTSVSQPLDAAAPGVAGTTEPTAVSRLLDQSLFWGDVAQPDGYSLSGVMRLAAKCNPTWGRFAANHAAAHAELLKALAYPNPEVEAEFGRAEARERDDEGHRPNRGVQSLSFTQPIELPGKRLARQAEAQAGFAVADGEGFEFSSTLRADVIEAYYTVQFYAAQKKLWQAMMDLSQELLTVAEQRVQLGEAGPIEKVNARIELLKARRERDAAARRYLGARAALNALTGEQLGRDFALSEGLPSSLRKRALPGSIEAAFACHPKLYRLKAELEQKYASLDRERTEWWPDLKLGIRQGTEFDAKSVAVTAGIEMPLWNRNEGNVAAAEAAAQKTYNDIAVAFSEVARDVETAYQNHELAREQLEAFEDGLMQASHEALSLAWTQYQQGAVGYLDLLTARRLLQETEQSYIQARYDAALAVARLDRAAGKIMDCPSSPRKTAKRTGSAKP